ncbi:MAG: hypothetical protein ACFE9S_01490 [Candidatus Hermodarchaeota archaeon]
MSDKDISYDVRLEEEFEKVKLKIWLLEELQLIPKEYHSQIIRNIKT